MIIPQQFNEGYRYGKADARIITHKDMRWISINNINHKHDDFILGWAKGFSDQKFRMEAEEQNPDDLYNTKGGNS